MYIIHIHMYIHVYNTYIHTYRYMYIIHIYNHVIYYMINIHIYIYVHLLSTSDPTETDSCPCRKGTGVSGGDCGGESKPIEPLEAPFSMLL